MAIKEVEEGGKPGYQAEEGGPVFTYDPEDQASKDEAYSKASEAAEKLSEYKSKLSAGRDPEPPTEDEEPAPVAAVELSQAVTVDALEIGADNGKDLHVMRLGKLFDLSSGELLLDLDEAEARKLALTTQALLDAGHAIPISFEHGIERVGQPGADPRPYGEIEAIYYDQERAGIYAKKKWTRLGEETLLAAVTEDGGTAYRISPRVRFSKAYHPTNGSVLGSTYVDVVSITTLPRTSSLNPVHLSRSKETSVEVFNSDQSCDTIAHMGSPVSIESGVSIPADQGRANQGQTGAIMADQDQIAEEAVTLLSRGSDEATRIYAATGLEVEAPAVELARRIESMKTELDEARVELSRYEEAETARKRIVREAEVDAELDKFEVTEGSERLLFRANLLSDDQATVELARDALIARGTPDKAVLIDDAITAAKERGALAADYVLTDDMRAQVEAGNVELAVNLINNIPGGNTVTLGEAAGSDAAGVDTMPVTDTATAEHTLARIARKKRANGEASTMIQAWELARTERADLAAVVYGD